MYRTLNAVLLSRARSSKLSPVSGKSANNTQNIFIIYYIAFEWSFLKSVAVIETLALRVFKVVNGPMDVVKTIDQMMSGLCPRLMEEREHVTFKSPNISRSLLTHGQKYSIGCQQIY